MGQIKVNNLTFKYDNGVNNIFENVNFNVDTNWKLGLIGRNGKGKTTLLKLLKGEYKYFGNITKNVEIEYFPYKVNEEKVTIDIVQAYDPNIEDWQVIKELNLLNVNIEVLYRKFNTLSEGEKIKVLLVILFLKDNKFLVIDEPTNHLDLESRKEISRYLNSKNGFILVSHDRNLLDETVDHIIAINNTDIQIQQGNYSSWKENMQRQNNYEIMQNEKIKKDINRLERASSETKKWSDAIEKSKYEDSHADKGYIGHKSEKMMKKSKVLEKRYEDAINEKGNLLKNIDRKDDLVVKPLEFDKKRIVLANHFQIVYDDNYVCNPISFEVNVGDRIALKGKNGSGKSSILKCIIKENLNYVGELNISNNLKISYISQNTSSLKGSLHNIAIEYNIDEAVFKAMLIKLGLSQEELDRNVEEYSEGQKKKVLIAKSITDNAHIYVWDEPLNYIDILSKEQIEEMILKYKPTMIFVEHDETFVNKIATKEIKL